MLALQLIPWTSMISVPFVLSMVGGSVSGSQIYTHWPQRPTFGVPSLPQVRDILARLQGPIVATVIERLHLPFHPSLYAGNFSELDSFLAAREEVAQFLNRYDYGTLEYAYTQPIVTPDVATELDLFPPGRFHQDTFNACSNISVFYTQAFLPFVRLANATTFFHLSNDATRQDPLDRDATLGVDVALLQLLSHRAHIGKLVAESKYASDVARYTRLVKEKDVDSIRILLTNVTQENLVLSQVDNTARTLLAAFSASGKTALHGFDTEVYSAVRKLYRKLIDITTEVEVEYLLQRFS